MRLAIFIFAFCISVPLSGQKWENWAKEFRADIREQDYAGALEAALKARDYALRKMDTTDLRYVLSHYHTAWAYHGLGEMETARTEIWTAYRFMAPFYASHSDQAADICQLYGRIEVSLGYDETAATLLTYARDVKVQLYGKENREYVFALYYLADLEMSRSQYGQMADLLEEALTIHEQYLEKDREFARYANYLGVIYMNSGNNMKAALQFDRVLSAYNTPGAEKDLTWANTNNNLGLIYYYRSDFENAARHFLKADSIYPLVVSGYSENYMMLINNMASLYYTWDKPVKAREAYVHLMAYLEQHPGHMDLQYIQGVENTANYYAAVGEFGVSAEYYEKAIALRRSLVPVDEPEVARIMLSLASVYKEGSRPDLAARVGAASYKVLAGELPPGNPDLVWTLTFLGEVCYDSKQFEKSFFYYERAREQMELDTSVHYADPIPVYNNLGILYNKQNRLLESVHCLEKAHELDPGNPATMINLGLTYFDLGNFPKARIMFDEAKKVYGKMYGTEHPDYAMALIHDISFRVSYRDFSEALLEEIREVERICMNSGVDSTSRVFVDCIRAYRNYYFGTKDYDRAVTYGIRASKLAAIGNGRISRFHAETLLEQADSYVMLGDLASLSVLYEEALEIAGQLDSIEREPLLQFIEAGRLIDQYYLEDYENARINNERVVEKEKSQFQAVQHILSAQERANFIGKLNHLGFYNNFLMLFPDNPEVVSNALNNRLFIKGILMDSEHSQRDALAQTGDTVILGLHEHYLEEKKKLANLRSAFGVEAGVLDSIESGIWDLEKEISRKLGEDLELAERSVTWEDIRNSLGEDEAAVEVIMFYHRTAPPRITYHPWYVAFVITREAEQPVYLQLFDAVEILPDYQSYRGSMVAGQEEDPLDPGLYDRLWSKDRQCG